MDGLKGLDAWITGGRYSKELLLVTCAECEEATEVTAETEYGGTEWTPDVCKHCGAAFSGDEEADYDEPDPDRYRD